LRPHLFVCALLSSDHLAQSIEDCLQGDRYTFSHFKTQDNFFNFIEQEKEKTDCLIFQNVPDLANVLSRLRNQAIFLPVVVLETSAEDNPDYSVPSPSVLLKSELDSSIILYHGALLRLYTTQCIDIKQGIEKAIDQFLKISKDSSAALTSAVNSNAGAVDPNSLRLQQQRLSEKLKERLGYLGVYYKRNSALFFRYMTQPQRQELIDQLKRDYRKIILNYFINDPHLNQKIDDFVNTAFFADISVSQIVEIHMELMDEFSKQLKLEGRSDEILLDYRLTLIDAIAHLCEMYRRSIPRES
jgi:circadian clock protein KaiA